MKNISGVFRCCVVLAVALGTGCGGITRDKVDNDNVGKPREAYRTKSGRTVRVAMGSITTKEELAAEVRDPVARYLRDGAKSALAQQDIFVVVSERNAGTNLLAKFMAANAGEKKTLEADADLDVEMREVNERLGATVKVGIVSSQKKYATAVVHVSLRMRSGGKGYEATGKGQSNQGAWGVVASVERSAMKKADVWKLDGSMAGTACMEALRAAVGDIARQIHRDVGRLTPDAADRLLRPQTVQPLPATMP